MGLTRVEREAWRQRVLAEIEEDKKATKRAGYPRQCVVCLKTMHGHKFNPDAAERFKVCLSCSSLGWPTDFGKMPRHPGSKIEIHRDVQAVLAVAFALISCLTKPQPQSTSKGKKMTRSNTGSRGIDLVAHVEGLLCDLQELRDGTLPIAQARIRAEVAREATRAMTLLAMQSAAGLAPLLISSSGTPNGPPTVDAEGPQD